MKPQGWPPGRGWSRAPGADRGTRTGVGEGVHGVTLQPPFHSPSQRDQHGRMQLEQEPCL